MVSQRFTHYKNCSDQNKNSGFSTVTYVLQGLGVSLLFGVRHDLLDEIVIVDTSVKIFLALEEIVDFVVVQFFTQIHQDVSQFGGGDEAHAVFVENL